LDKKVGVAVVGAGLVGGQAHVPAFNKFQHSFNFVNYAKFRSQVGNTLSEKCSLNSLSGLGRNDEEFGSSKGICPRTD
jgi:predicted dehydrogenase